MRWMVASGSSCAHHGGNLGLLLSLSPCSVLSKRRAVLLLDKLQGRGVLDAGVGHPRVISADLRVYYWLAGSSALASRNNWEGSRAI